MALCDLGARELLTKAILFDIAQDPRTNGLQEGQTYPADQTMLNGLDEIGLQYLTQLYLVQPGGREFTVHVNVPQSVAESYGQSAQGQRTTAQRQTRNDKSDESITAIAQGLHDQIAVDAKRLNDFADSVLLSAKSIERHVKGDSDLAEAMSEVWTALKQDPDGKAKIRMIGQFLAEAKGFMAAKVKQVAGFDLTDPLTKDANEAAIMEIEKQVDLYAPVIKEFYNFLIDAPDSNPVKKIVNAAFDDMASLIATAHKVHKSSALRPLMEALLPSMEKARAEKEADIRRLEGNLARVRSLKEQSRIISKIEQIKADIEKFLNPENVELTLLGKNGDATVVGKFLVAGMGNKDIVVQGFMRIIKDAYQKAVDAFRPIGAEIGERFKALQMSTGNIDEAFKDLYTTVRESFFNEATGEIETQDTLFFQSEVSEAWRTTFTDIRARLSKSTKEIMDKWKANATADELRPLEEAHEAIKTEYIQFRRANFETEYGDRYQAADALLDTPIVINGSPVTPREVRATYYDAIGQIQTLYNALTGVPSEQDIEAINALRLKFEEQKSLSGKVPGSGEYQMAEVFQAHAAEMKEMTERWETSAASLDKFNIRKADIDKRYEAGEIDKEARDRWYTANTTTVYNPKYWQERRATVEKLNSLAEGMARITGHAKENSLKANYEEMESIAKKYRDSNSHIDGTKLTPAESEKVLESEQDIEALKREMKQAYSGFLGADFQAEFDDIERQRDVLAEEIRKLRADDPAYSNSTRQQIAELRKQSRALAGSTKTLAAKHLAQKGVTPADIRAFQALYDEYMAAVRHLSELTESVETQYYYETYQSELNRFLAGKTQAERDAKVARTNTLTVGVTKYKKGADGEFYEIGFDGLPVEESTPAVALMDAIFKKDFEGSQWFQDNHFEADRWEDGGTKKKMIPIYSWRISEPRDKRFIKEHAPSIAWKRRIIKPEYRNPNYGLSPDGLPKLKQGLHENTGYQALRATNPALWSFRDRMIEIFLDAQNEDLAGQRTLGMRVPTKERNASLYDTVQRRGKGVGEQISRKFKITGQEVDEGVFAFADSAGYEKKFVPVKFQGRLEADLVSKNIVETIGQYAAQAKLHKARTELLDIGKSLETTLKAYPPTAETQDRGASWMGVVRRNLKRGENQRLDTIRNLIDMFVYGETAQETTVLGKKIHKVLGNLLGVKATLLFSEFAPILHTTITGVNSIGGATWSQVVNLFGGTAQSLIRSAVKSGNAKFTLADYAWSVKTYAANSAAFVADVGKVSHRSYWSQMAELFDTRELHYVNEFGEQLYSKGLARQLQFSNLAFAKMAVEHELMMTPFMSFARNYHVSTPTGRVALKDAFELQGGRLVQKAGVDISEAEMSDIRGYVNSLLRDINGNYSALDRVYLEQLWYGKAIMFLRKWLIPMVVNRYSAKKFTIEQDRIATGHIRESISMAISALTGGIQGKPSPKSWTGWPMHIARSLGDADAREIAALFHPGISLTMTESEKDSLRKTRMEVLLLLAMWVGYRFAMGYDPDDEDRFKEMEKKSVFLQGLEYSLIKAESEQSTFLPFAGVSEAGKMSTNLLSNTAPMLSEIWKMASQDINYTEVGTPDFFERYKRDTGLHDKGDTKLAAHAFKMLGLTSLKQSPIEGLKSFETSLNMNR
jgi:uncharacterized protein YukE